MKNLLMIMILIAILIPAGFAIAGELHEAAKNGDWDALKYLLDKGVQINQKDNQGATALHYVASSHTVGKSQVGFKDKFESWTKDKVNEAALGRLEVVKLLLAAGADINAKDNGGITPLYLAVSSGRLKLVESLLANGANPKIPDNHGITPLHVVVQKGYKEIADLLIDKGCDVNTKASGGVTPLHKAAFHERNEMIKFLLGRKGDVDIRDDTGKTPLHWAVMRGHYPSVETLALNGATIDMKDDVGGSPLHYAVAAVGSLASELGISEKRKLAVDQNLLSIVSFLIKQGADINLTDNDCRAPLHMAVIGRSKSLYVTKIVNLLLGNGADLNIKDKNGKTPKEIAMEANKDEVVFIMSSKPVHAKISETINDSAALKLLLLDLAYWHRFSEPEAREKEGVGRSKLQEMISRIASKHSIDKTKVGSSIDVLVDTNILIGKVGSTFDRSGADFIMKVMGLDKWSEIAGLKETGNMPGIKFKSDLISLSLKSQTVYFADRTQCLMDEKEFVFYEPNWFHK